jgi:hypothetical protein
MMLRGDLNLPLLTLLSGFAIQWVDLGPLSLAQVASLMVGPVFLLNGPRLLPIGDDTLAIKSYAIFLMCLTFGFTYTQDSGEGFVALVRGAAYLSLSYLFYAWLRSIPEDRCIRTLSRAIFYAAPAFFLIFLIAANSAGVNILKEVQFMLSSGNPNWLQYRIFTVVLNNGVIDEGGYSSAARHGIMVSLMTVAHLHLMLRPEKSRVGSALAYFIYFFVFFSLSRSAILGMLLGYLCAATVQIFAGTFPIKRFFFIGSLPLAFVMATGFLQSSGISLIFADKFVSDVADNPRIYEFLQIIDLLETHAIFGWGTGTPLGLEGVEAQYPHNFILYGWHQAGLLGLAATTLFVAVIITGIFSGLSNAVRWSRADAVRSRVHLLGAMLFCIVFVRLMFAKAGLLALPEWIALSLAVYAQRVASHSVSVASGLRIPR